MSEQGEERKGNGKKKNGKRKRRPKGEGGCFYSEAKNVWIARAIIGTLPTGKPKYKEVTGRTQTEALQKKREAEEDAKAGRITTGKPMLTGEYLQHWLDNVAKPSVRESTWQSYERCIRVHIKDRIGGHKLGDLRQQHIEKFFAELDRSGVSRGNAKKVSEVLSSALEHAVRSNLVNSNPASSVRKPQPEEEEIQPFTAAEAKKILEAARGLRLEALFPLAFATGARQGELLALAWDHVDLVAGTIRIERGLVYVKSEFILREPKSKRGRRVVELPRFATLALTEHRKRMLAEGNLGAQVVFCSRVGGFIEKSNLVAKVYKPLLKRAEVPYRKFHSIRHTHVSELLARGESIVDVARRVGDRPEVILKNYAHFIPGGGKGIAGRLDEMYG